MRKYGLVIMTAILLAGCTTFNDSAGKSLATIATAVDKAMESWGVLVRAHVVTLEQEMTVKKFYSDYQVSMSAAESMYLILVKTGDKTAYNLAYNNLVSKKDLLLNGIATEKAKIAKQ